VAAKSSQLGLLHEAVAKVFVELATDGREVVVKGKEEDEVVRVPATAADLAVMVTFLKNNNITADADTNEALSGLKAQLAARAKQRQPLSTAALDEAAEALAHLGVGGMQ